MVLLVTRPEPQASAWADALTQAGVAAQALPVIAISAPPQPDDVAQLWRQLSAQRALMFVSPAAVNGFFELRPAGCTWPLGTIAAAPGPGTAEALQQAGAACGLHTDQIVSPTEDAPQFDSEHLWPLLAPLNWHGGSVTIVSGGDAKGAQGRTWLTERWREAGAQVATVQTYQRGAGTWTAEQAELARQALTDEASVWLLSSSQALDFLIDHHLPQLGPDHWQPDRAANLHLLCTHPRIAQHAAKRGIRHARQCTPTLESVVQARRLAG